MTEEYTVEDLNPRSKAVKSLEMVVRKAVRLDDLCVRHLELCKGDPHEARRTHPRGWGSIDKTPGGPENPKTILGELAGTEVDRDADWPLLWDAWQDGSLRRQIASLLATLPASIRDDKRYRGYM